jgi:hypothetical protein
MAEIFIKYVAKYITGSNPEQLRSMEHMLPELHTYNLPSLHKFYNAIFPKLKEMPMFGILRKQPRIILAKDISNID